MRSDRERYLREYFAPPETAGKEAFFQKIGKAGNAPLRFLKERDDRIPPITGVWNLVWSQLRYISGGGWLISMALFAISLAFSCLFRGSRMYVGTIYAIAPFLAMAALGNTMRSWRCGMEELEAAARYSLKSVVLVRMLILGLGNVAVMLLAAWITLPMIAQDCRWYEQLLYLSTPYFLTSGIGVAITRRFRDRMGSSLCLLVTLLAALFLAYGKILVGMRHIWLYEPDYLGYWAAACLLSLIGYIAATYRTFFGMEELAWN